ncbi:hypothetical protein PSTT_05616 [Puccinia striiformis]|uniref:Uncharacterized protein n=1 Tax=Puccinia striiformis TaxID=27350 RepID=A0A2S4VMW2_9BASI|nr:hypothetical protein PSTT_05616 [Puccinia striiformis]
MSSKQFFPHGVTINSQSPQICYTHLYSFHPIQTQSRWSFPLANQNVEYWDKDAYGLAYLPLGPPTPARVTIPSPNGNSTPPTPTRAVIIPSSDCDSMVSNHSCDGNSSNTPLTPARLVSNAPSDQGHHHSPATPPLSWNAPSDQSHHSPTPTLPPATQQISKRFQEKNKHMLYDYKKRTNICCIKIFPPMKPTPTIHQYHTFWSLLYPILRVRMCIPKLEQVVINSKRIQIKVILEEYLAIGFP